MFPLHTVLPSSRAWFDATIGGQPVVDAGIRPMGIDYSASVMTADHGFHRFCRNEVEAQRFILSHLDGYEIQLTELQQRAVDLVAKFGPFVTKKERDAITAFTTFEYWHDDYKPKKLQAVVDKIERRVCDKAKDAKVKAIPGIVVNSWLTDDQVVAGVRYLTGLDSDMGALDNDEGWNPNVSANGHLANGLLDTDRAAAILIARKFIGGYTRQLRAGGVI